MNTTHCIDNVPTIKNMGFKTVKLTIDQLERLKSDYEEKILSIRALAKKWAIAPSTLQIYAKRYGWAREIEKSVKHEVSQETYKKVKRTITGLSKENKKKILEAGGDDLYKATVEYFQNANKVQAATLNNLIYQKKLFDEGINGPDVSMCDGAKEKLELQLSFYLTEQQKIEWVLTHQKFIQSAAKSATEMINGVRGSLGLNNQTKDEKGGDTYNIVITDKLKGALNRTNDVTDKELPKRIIEVEPL